MKRFVKTLLVVTLLSLPVVGHAAQTNAHTTTTTNTNSDVSFDTLKSLVGNWQGTKEGMGEKGNASVKYHLTSGGTAVEEVLFPGTNHEMVSMYFKDGNGTKMTHYCAMGNQPTFKLKSAAGNKLVYTLDRTSGLKTRNEAHMSELVILVKDKNHIEQTWSMMKNGKNSGDSVFHLNRVRTAKTATPVATPKQPVKS